MNDQIRNHVQISLKQIIFNSYKYKTKKYLYGCKNTSYENKRNKKNHFKTCFHKTQKVFGTQNLLGPRKLGL